MRILLVGQPHFQEEIKRLLSESDYAFDAILTASNDETALLRIRDEEPAIAFVHTGIHRANFVETLKKIKQIDQDIEVILCGVLPTSALAISALNSGACYFLIEPFDRRNFATSLKKALHSISRHTPSLSDNLPAPQPRFSAEANLKKALAAVEQAYSRDFSLEEVARMANMSVSYFCALFRQEKGISFKEYMIRVRIRYAKELLQTSDAPVNKIAEMVGYSDPNYFAKVFRARERRTPSQYREDHMASISKHSLPQTKEPPK